MLNANLNNVHHQCLTRFFIDQIFINAFQRGVLGACCEAYHYVYNVMHACMQHEYLCDTCQYREVLKSASHTWVLFTFDLVYVLLA